MEHTLGNPSLGLVLGKAVGWTLRSCPHLTAFYLQKHVSRHIMNGSTCLRMVLFWEETESKVHKCLMRY